MRYKKASSFQEKLGGLKSEIKRKGDTVKTVFYLTPESQQDAVIEEFSEETLKLKTVSELKTLAKEKGIVGLSKMKKAELVRILAQ